VAHFADDNQLRRHFQRHRGECGATADEYLARASALCDGDDCPDGVRECFRKCQNEAEAKRVRFRLSTGEFGVVLRDQPDVLVTYHVLHAVDDDRPDVTYKHDFYTNIDFFVADCDCRGRHGQERYVPSVRI
jgi:hypothetical protein